MIDMLYLTNKKTMNFIVAYNQLDAPNTDVLKNLNSTRRKTSLCAPTNRNISNIFPTDDEV